MSEAEVDDEEELEEEFEVTDFLSDDEGVEYDASASDEDQDQDDLQQSVWDDLEQSQTAEDEQFALVPANGASRRPVARWWEEQD
jgi:hypothetical protein